MKYPEKTVTLLLLRLFLVSFAISFNKETNNTLCIKTEKQALLNFKKSLIDPSHILYSWNGSTDCCSWENILCDDVTGHVREILLQRQDYWNSQLGGIIDPSLLDLKHLAFLDLSQNNFQGEVPYFIGSMVSLEYLNLSLAGFQGLIPHNFGNLSSLRGLGLSGSLLEVENIQWLSGLAHMEFLDLNYVNLSRESNWLKVVNMLPHLIELHLSSCSLGRITALDRLNFSSLEFLDLSSNQLGLQVPNWIFNLTNLVSLQIQGNSFRGPIPSDKNMAKLRVLDLSQNSLNFSLPSWLFRSYNLEYLSLSNNFLRGAISGAIANLTYLRIVDLSTNEFSRKIPGEIGKLCHLQKIDDLSFNSLEGNFSEVFGSSSLSKCFLASLEELYLRANHLSGELTEQLGDYKSMQTLDLGNNSFVGSLPSVLGNVFSLITLRVDNNKLTGNIPSSIGLLSNLEALVMENNMFEGVVTENHFSSLTELKYLSASGNPMILRVSKDWIPPFQLETLFLDSWDVGPRIPLWLETQTSIYNIELSNTGISGEIPTWFWSLPSLDSFNLSHNQLSGEIPDLNGLIWVCLSSNRFSGQLPIVSSSMSELDLSNNTFSGGISRMLCRMSNITNSLTILHLKRNGLSGEIPDCWINWPSLSVINLGSNKFYGKIPGSLGILSDLQSLNLYNNNLYGRIPSSLRNCTRLIKLDLSENKLEGSIPAWIGTSLSNLKILILRSNKFSGQLTPEICKISYLHILDLADNTFSGSIPSCFNNLILMSSQKSPANFTGLVYYSYFLDVFMESASVTTKGSELQYDTILSLFNSIDLSNNQLSGSIPYELTSLTGLRSLNLSGNSLSGFIPDNIGNMVSLESLDFSRNRLSGEIPIGLARLTALDYLNFSYNDLSGRIPQSTQLQSLNSSSFIGNELCGPPLSNNCNGDDQNTILSSSNKSNASHHEGFGLEIDIWFYVCMCSGFIVGFFIWWAAFICNNSWRYVCILSY